jgi:hypothetical protein
METGIAEGPARHPGPVPPSEVVFTLTLEDYTAYSLYHFDRMAGRRPRHSLLGLSWGLWALHGFLLGTVALAVGSRATLDPGLRSAHVFFESVAAACLMLDLIVWAGMVRRRLLRRQYRSAYIRRCRREYGDFGEYQHRLRLRPDYLLDVSNAQFTEPGILRKEQHEVQIAWSAAQKVKVVGPRTFFLLPGDRAIILPLSGFADEGAFHHFVNTARAYHADALAALAPSSVLNTAPEERLRPAGPP